MDILTLISRIESRNLRDYAVLSDYFEACKLAYAEHKDAVAPKIMEIGRICDRCAQESMGDNAAFRKFFDLKKAVCKQLARDYFEYFLFYVEWDRQSSKKFYPPRRKVLKPLVDALQDLSDKKIKFLGISLPPRVGKLVADDTPVLTRNGWKNHGELAVGDEVVSPTGEFVRVTHVHPKNYANVRCHFTDGSYIDVHENHEWVVFDRHKLKYVTHETRYMMEHEPETGEPGKRGHRYFYLLPQKAYLQGEFKRLPVQPYAFGAWLGDGTNTNPTVCCDPADRCVPESIIADGYAVSWHTVHKDTGVEYFGFKELRKGLQEMGMCHSRRRTPKHIPECYLTASIEQRLDLLAGLLDTDGTLIRNEHRYQFVTADEMLKETFVQLIATFGWRTSVTEIKPSLSSSGIQGKKTYWSIGFNPDCYIPCRVERKQLHEYSKQRRIAFAGFERIEPVQGNCITADGGVYCVGHHMLPTHNSTLCVFFMTWHMGRYPDTANVASGHSDKLTDSFFRELLSIMTDADTYHWAEIFPESPVVNTSAKNESIDLVREKRFPTITCRSVGGTLTGAVEIGEDGVLYCDDLVEDLEESLNPDRLQAKYDAYLNQLKDRKKDGAVELMVGTRWNVLDPLGRIHDMYADDPAYRFIVIPALNEQDESNFDYNYGVGFSTAYYHDMRANIDRATWWAKYMGSPYVREGLLFPAEELQYYNGVLPDGEPDRIVAACDVAWGGGDYLSMPVCYCYGDAWYIHDVVFSNLDKTVTQPLVEGKLSQHLPHSAVFEANNGGHEYCSTIDTRLRDKNVRLNLTSRPAPTKTSKIARIVKVAPEIRKMFFIQPKYASQEYRAFLNQVCTFVITGKNEHDDAPDSLAMIVDAISSNFGVVTVMERPF